MTFIKVKRREKSNNLYRGIDLEEHTEKGHMEEHLEEGASEHLEEEHLLVPHLASRPSPFASCLGRSLLVLPDHVFGYYQNIRRW